VSAPAGTRSRVLRSLTAIYWLSIFTFTHLPPSKLPETHVSDWVEHFVAYAVLGLLLCASLRVTRPRWSIPRVALLALSILLIYGAVDELTQPLVHRICSLDDWFADALGAAAGVAAAMLLGRALAREAPRS
jgi:VanZ family protein